jgi:hypothetical protein
LTIFALYLFDAKMVRKIDRYNSDEYQHIRTLNPASKDEAYFLKNAEAIYSAYLRGATGVSYAEAYDYETLRLFGDGRQSEERYKKYFTREELPSPESPATLSGVLNSQSHEGKRKGYFNVLWDVVSPSSKIVNTLIGNFLSYEYDVSADPVDAYSKNFIEDEKIRLWVEKENIEYFKMLYQQIGLQYKAPEFVPETVEELELYEMNGGFKPAYAKAMELVIKHSMDISYWRDEVKKQLYKDIINLGLFCVRDYYCKVDNKIKARYVDPEYLVLQYSRHPDFRDIEFAGEFYDVSITELLAEGFSREQLEGVANEYSGYKGNPTAEKWGIYNTQVEANIYGYDFYKVCVFDCEWVDSDAKTTLIHKNRFGKETMTEVEYGYSKRLTPNQRLVNTQQRFRYCTKWIVGSKLIYDHKKDTDQTRPNKKSVSLTFHPYKLGTKSITRQLIPLYDNFQIFWIKYQNAIAMAVNSGYAINVDSLANIKSVKGKDAREEGIKRFLESGFFFYKENNPQGMRNTIMRPIEQLPGGIGQIFTDIIAGFQFNARMIEDITGINPVALGATPNPSAPVGTTEIAVRSMTTTLKPLLSAYLYVKQATAQNICRWVQVGVRYNRLMRESYASAIGDFNIQLLAEAEGDNVLYGVNLVARPTDVEKKELYESAKISLMNGREGKPGIDESDFFAIVRIIEGGGSLLFGETVLHNRIRKAREEFQRSQMNMQAMNAEIQQKAQEAARNAVLAEKKIDHDYKLQEMGVEHQYHMKEIRAQEGIRTMKEVGVARIKGEQKEGNPQPETVEKT